jgi:site-specific DNA recombinase
MRIAMYVRVSTQTQVQAQTIEEQLARLQQHCQQQGWTWTERSIFRDDGYSGASLSRPGLDRLREAVAGASFDRVLITAPDRLARKYVHQVMLIEELEQHGCPVEFLDRPMSHAPDDQLLLQIRGAVSEYERSLITERMRRGRQYKYQAGTLLPWTQAPYGYVSDPDRPRSPANVRLEVPKAALVAEMFSLYLEPHCSLAGVAKHLMVLGIPAPQGGKRWNCSTVRRMLSNPVYMGNVYAGRERARPITRRRSALGPIGKRANGRALQPPEDWILVGHVPPIVTPEQFEAVQAKLATNPRWARRNNTVRQYLLRAMLSCGQCRHSYVGRARGHYIYYECCGHGHPVHAHLDVRCPSRCLPSQPLDDLVWADLCNLLTHPTWLTQAFTRAQTGAWLPQELQARQDNLRRADLKLAQQLDRLTQAYLENILALDEYRRRHTDLQSQRQALHDQAQQLNSQADRQLELTGYVHHLEDFCQRVQTALHHATFDQKRQLVELLIDRVVITGDQVEIRYVIPTAPGGELTRFCYLRTAYC